MHPWLLYTEQLAVPTYFTCLMVGLSLASAVLRREARRRDLPARLVMDAALWILPGSLLGARLAHVVLEAPAFYAENPTLILAPNGGWVFYGGLFGALLSGASFARHRGVDLWTLCDVFAPATAFGLAFGRLGCLGGGCCFGRPADWPFRVEVPWSVRYFARGQLPEELLAVPLHPAPLYEALLCLALFVALSRLAERQRFTGQVLLGLVVGYGLARSFVEMFRADTSRGLWLGGWVSTSQLIGLGSAAVAAWLWTRRSRTCTPSSSI